MCYLLHCLSWLMMQYVMNNFVCLTNDDVSKMWNLAIPTSKTNFDSYFIFNIVISSRHKSKTLILTSPTSVAIEVKTTSVSKLPRYPSLNFEIRVWTFWYGRSLISMWWHFNNNGIDLLRYWGTLLWISNQISKILNFKRKKDFNIENYLIWILYPISFL